MQDPIADVIGRVYAMCFLLMGISHVVQPALWADFIIDLKRANTAPLKIVAFTLPFGLLVIVGHPVWTPDAHGLITFFGWITTVKCITYLLFPQAMWKLSPSKRETFVPLFRYGGCLPTVIGAYLVWATWGENGDILDF